MYQFSYHILPCKHPWVLEIRGQLKNGGGLLHREAIHAYNVYLYIYVNHIARRFIKMESGHLHGNERLLGILR